jgi:hypothetical protein
VPQLTRPAASPSLSSVQLQVRHFPIVQPVLVSQVSPAGTEPGTGTPAHWPLQLEVEQVTVTQVKLEPDWMHSWVPGLAHRVDSDDPALRHPHHDLRH